MNLYRSAPSFSIILGLSLVLQCRYGNAQTCYYPNGDVAKDSKPCSSGVMCCPDTWDCLSNGLCQLKNAGYFGRYSCTDKSWSSDSGCPQFCTANSTTGDEAVLECTQGNYCCDTNRPTIGCCDTGGTLFSLQDADGQLPFNPANGGAPSSTAAPADTSEPSNSAPPLPTPTAPTAASSTQAPAPSTASSSSSPAALSTSVPSNSPGSEASQGGQQSQSPTSLSTLSASFTTTLRGQTLDPNTRTSQDPSVIIVTSTITNSVGSSTILTTAVPASSTNVPVAAPTPQPHKSNILGPAIGVPVGVVVLALIIAFFLWRYRRSKQRGRAEDDPTRYNYDRKGDFGPPSIAVPGSLVVRQGHSQPGLGDNGIDTDAITGGGATGQSQYRGVPTTVQRMPKQSHLSPPLGGVPVSLSHSELSGSMPITPPPPHYNEIDGREKAAERQAIQYELPGN